MFRLVALSVCVAICTAVGPGGKVQVVLKESNVPNAGLGLFLSDDSEPVEAGMVVAHYGGKDGSISEGGAMLYAMASAENASQMRIGKPWDGEVPHLIDADEHLGYMVNDPAAIILETASSRDGGPVLRGGLKELRALVDQYYATEGKKANVGSPQGADWAIHATRSIQPGEELYMTYGAEYWLWQLLYAPMDKIDPFDRLVVYLNNIQGTADLATRAEFVFLDEVGRPMFSSTSKLLQDEQCAGFLVQAMGFVDGRGEVMMHAAGVTPDMGACEVLRRLFLYATDPQAEIPPAPLSLDMVHKIQAELGQFLRLPTPNAWLEVRESSIPGAGLGLFLSSDSTPVAKDTILTVYGGRTMPAVLVADKSYALGIEGRLDITLVGEPWQGEVPAMVMKDMAVGHLINDGAVIALAEDTDALLMGLEGLHEVIDAYYNASKDRQNIDFGHGKVVGCWDMVATREIQPGEEIFFSYGYSYWLSQAYNSPDPLQRLLVYVHCVTFDPEVLDVKGYVSENSEGKLVLWPMGVEVDEFYCAELLHGFLGLEGEKGKRALERAGVPEGLPAKETFKRLVAAVKQSGGNSIVARARKLAGGLLGAEKGSVMH